MEFSLAPDIQKRITFLVKNLELSHMDAKRIICFRSTGSVSRARARIWSLPQIWQLAFEKPAHYCIEVLSRNFDHLTMPDQEKVLIHELLHIPKTFSGALVPHRHKTRRTFRHYHDEVEALFKSLASYSFDKK